LDPGFGGSAAVKHGTAPATRTTPVSAAKTPVQAIQEAQPPSMLLGVFQWWIKHGRLFPQGPFDYTYEQFLRDPVQVKSALSVWFREVSDLPKQDEKAFVAHYSESAAASDFLHEAFQWWRRVGYSFSQRERAPTCTYEQFLRDSDMVSRALVTWFREMSDEDKHEEARFVNHHCRCAADIAI
jgi:hypothetical protein